MVARVLLTFLGLACASAAALVFLPLAIIFDPLVQSAASDLPADHWLDILAGILSQDAPEDSIATLFHLLWTIGMLVCVLPVTIVALVGSISGTRGFVFHAAISGVLAAAMPWVLRSGRIVERGAQMSPAEGHLTLILFLTGVVAGTVYWLIAGRQEASPSGAGWMSSQPRE